ncbi:MAG: hypothetical protein AB7T49_17465 [Oligoflexales bacterium]
MKSKMLISAFVLLAGCTRVSSEQHSRRSRTSSGPNSGSKTETKTGDDVKSLVDPEEELQVFLTSVASADPATIKESMAKALIAIQVKAPENANPEKGRCLLVSTKEAFPEGIKKRTAADVDYVNTGSYFTVISKATTLESTDCVDFFKQRLGFRFETHYLSQHVAFFSYNL